MLAASMQHIVNHCTTGCDAGTRTVLPTLRSAAGCQIDLIARWLEQCWWPHSSHPSVP